MEQWLTKNMLGYSGLKQEEKNTIYHFTLLWTLIEAKVLDCSGNADKITESVKRLSITRLIQIENFSESKNYFFSRYITEGVCNDFFKKLNFRSNDKRKFVEDVLIGKMKKDEEILIALLIIVYRLRNNFFHGEKWAYEIEGQLDNFKYASKLLKYTIEQKNSKKNRD